MKKEEESDSTGIEKAVLGIKKRKSIAELYPLSEFPPPVGEHPGGYGKNPHDHFDNLLMGSFSD